MNTMALLAATLHTAGYTLRERYDRVRDVRGSSERGDGPVDNAIIIGTAVTVGLIVVGLITAAVSKYGAKIR